MQSNDSRLFKRTLRAETTLVLVVVVITSWSVYALYKIAIGGSDTILGVNIGKLLAPNYNQAAGSSPEEASSRNDSTGFALKQQASNVVHSEPLQEADQLVESAPAARQNLINQVLQEVLAKRRQLFGEQQNPSGPGNQQNQLDLLTKLYRNQLLDGYLRAAKPQLPLNPNFNQETSELAEEPPMDSDERELEAKYQEPEEGSLQQQPASEAPEDREVAESNSDPTEALIRENSNEEIPTPIKSEDETEALVDESEEEDSNNEPLPPQEIYPKKADNSVEQKQGESIAKEAENPNDEEADRMTQPSSPEVVSSQQDHKPFDYKNTVQFDDSVATSSSSSTIKGRAEKKAIQSGHSIASFLAPTNNSSAMRHDDLQVDHNKLKVISKEGKLSQLDGNKNKTRAWKGAGHQQQPFRDDKMPSRKKLKTSKNQIEPRATIDRKKRAARTIESLGGLENFLADLDFDSLSGEPTTRFETTISQPVDQPRDNVNLESAKVVGSGKNKTRRSDEDEEEDEEEDEGDANQSDSNSNEDAQDNQNPSNNLYDNNPITQGPYGQYVFSNDSDLQNLLAEKRLLEALSQSQLPAPLGTLHQAPGSNSTLVATSQSSKPGHDHQQTASSLYTVDHGLLLTPSAEEESHYKAHSSKKKKHGKMKKKKKMTIAMKKGGHKKKKHKKMEKKFLKEKKFKGAKKGLKKSKGKGGKGGKKGKKLYKDKGFKKKGFKNVYHKEEFGKKSSFFDEYRDKDFKKKWKKFDDKYKYEQMKKWQGTDRKGAKKMKDHSEKFKKYDKSKWKKKYQKDYKEHMAKESSKKKKKHDGF